MKKFLSVLALASTLLIGGCTEKTKIVIEPEPPVYVVEEDLTETYETIKNSVVYIYSYNDQAFEAGSGVVFKESEEFVYILTNKHVVGVMTSFYEEYYDYYGNVDGVVSYVPYKNNNKIISYVRPNEQEDRAMDNVLKNNKHARADLHIEVQEYKDMLPSLKAVMNIQGLKSTDLIITKVTGFSQSAGVAIRSRLVSVNGIEIKDKASLVDVLYGFESGDSIDIVVQVTTDIYKTHTIVA